MSDTDEARALFRQGRQAMAERRHGDALATFRELVDRFGTSRDVTIDRIVGNAMHGMALNLALIERDREALAAYDEIIARYRDAEDRALRGHLARALLNRGLALEQMGHHEQAIETWDDVIARFDADERFRAPALLAREQKASTLRALDRLDEALALYDDVLLRAADADPRQVQRHTDLALSNKAFVLLLQDRLDEAIVVADATVERLDDSERPADLAIAVLNLAGALVKRGRLEEALDVYQGLTERLGADPAPEVLEHLIVAVTNEVEVLGMLGRAEDAEETHADVLQRFGEKVPRALQRAAARNEQDEGGAPVVAGLLLKQAIALFQLERDDEALICVNDLIERFSDETNPEVERVLAMARAFRQQLREEE
jgi:tetratricopeptide (TPR) repeat protein